MLSCNTLTMADKLAGVMTGGPSSAPWTNSKIRPAPKICLSVTPVSGTIDWPFRASAERGQHLDLTDGPHGSQPDLCRRVLSCCQKELEASANELG